MLILRITKKRNLIPLFFILLSCFGNSYKSDIHNKTQLLLEGLQSGNIELLPGYSEYKEKLDNETLNKLKESFMSISDWQINVQNIKNEIVDVLVDIKMNGEYTNFIFQYKLENKTWVLQKEMNIKKNYEVVE